MKNTLLGVIIGLLIMGVIWDITEQYRNSKHDCEYLVTAIDKDGWIMFDVSTYDGRHVGTCWSEDFQDLIISDNL